MEPSIMKLPHGTGALSRGIRYFCRDANCFQPPFPLAPAKKTVFIGFPPSNEGAPFLRLRKDLFRIASFFPRQ